ncbi:iron reductase [Streptomyces sp. AD55]|uniref:iron reductase n=1 Tax=Streptomyces sp. AD55 TaxID=3242895 RepID=UPI003528CE85
MSASPPAAGADEASVTAALADVARYGGFFALTVGGPAEGWHPVGASYARGFADLARAVAERHRAPEPRVGLSIAHLGHVARLWSPALACTVVHGIVPDLTALQRSDDGPALRLPRAAGWHAAALPDPAGALAGQVHAHLRAFAAGPHPRIAHRLLDGNAASALAEAARALLAAHPGLRDALAALTADLLGRPPLTGTGRLTGANLAFRRRSCCLYYRAPAGRPCGDCCLTAPHDTARAGDGT